jgi:ectoine hydroxylase-related dioxygenase (phytanoyl-CoA dioxygenase family)
VLAPERRFPELLKTDFCRNGRSLASALFGIEPDKVAPWGHMIRKPPKIGGPLPWHQDEAYWDPAFDYRALGCWMTLDPATIESGCMSMIPGSHRGEILPHRHIGDDPTVHGLQTWPDEADIARAEPLPVGPGGAVLHTCRTLHSSGPNVSDHVRRAFAMEWQTPPVPRETPYERPWHWDGRDAFETRQL